MDDLGYFDRKGSYVPRLGVLYKIGSLRDLRTSMHSIEVLIGSSVNPFIN